MLVAIISDTHMPRGPRRLPPVCVAHLRRADAILHAGDVMTAEVLADIAALGPPVHAVRGNVDDATLIPVLPPSRIVDLAGARIGIVHDAGAAAGRLARLRRRFPDCQAVVFGHSHLPLHEREDDFQIFNPGSPTERRRAPRHTMGLARIEAGAVELELVALD